MPDPASMAPIELYYWPTPNGWKITIFCEEAGYPYEIKYIDIRKGEQFAPDFLKIAPNNRMPAIVDPDGPGGQPVSVFESGAILQYLGRKTGAFYPADERARVAVDEWLFWQMGNLGPMAGQARHFITYSREKFTYPIERYTNEVHRLFGVMDTRLEGRDYLAGDYSVADMACIGWVRYPERRGLTFDEFPNLKAWHDRMLARPGVERGFAVGLEHRSDAAHTEEERKVLFGQRAQR